MKIPSWRTLTRGASLQRDAEEIKSLLIRYLKEETLAPLKQMGRFALYGALGSLFVGFGTTMLLLAVLRFLQEQFSLFRGNLSWLAYFIVALLALSVCALTLWRIVSGTAKRRLKKSS